MWRFVTTQLGGAHALARIPGFLVYSRFRTDVFFTFDRYLTSFYIIFYFHGVV